MLGIVFGLRLAKARAFEFGACADGIGSAEPDHAMRSRRGDHDERALSRHGSDEDRRRISSELGVEDAWPVVAEPFFVPAALYRAASNTASLTSSPNGHESPASSTRRSVSRTVEGAAPTRTAIALWPRPSSYLSQDLADTPHL
jgi:hypothetical protein